MLLEDKHELFSKIKNVEDITYWWDIVIADLVSRAATSEEQQALKERLERIAIPLSKNKKNIELATLNFIENLFKDLPHVIGGKEYDRDKLLREATAMQALQSIPGTHDDEEKILTAYLKHFSSEGATKHTGHELFASNALKSLQRSWGGHLEVDGHPLTQAVLSLQKLEKSLSEDSDEKISVTLVPVRGILRIFSGDIGDACYTSCHNELARGDYERLTSFIYVVGRGTSYERLQGSVLIIETKTLDGEPVLLIRANNPRESLLREVNSEKLLKTVLSSLTELAKKRGITKVVVPLDKSSSSCSNRPLVAEYYAKHFGAKPKLDLVNEPETNFNGYSVWNKGGAHGVIDILS